MNKNYERAEADLKELLDDLACARDWLVQTHMRIAEMLTDPTMRHLAVGLGDDYEMYPEDAARYARIAVSGLHREALRRESLAFLPTDLTSLDWLARLSQGQLEALDQEVFLDRMCRTEIEREVWKALAGAYGATKPDAESERGAGPSANAAQAAPARRAGVPVFP